MCIDYDIDQLEEKQNEIIDRIDAIEPSLQRSNNVASAVSEFKKSLDHFKSLSQLTSRRYANNNKDPRPNEMEYVNGLRERRFAPASCAVMIERIQMETLILNELERSDSEGYAFIPDENVIKLMNKPMNVKLYSSHAMKHGRLLSWKNSYKESVIDSYRKQISYEELREQGDWLVSILRCSLFSVARFVHGGKKYITSYKFKSQPADIYVENDQLHIKQVNDILNVHRTKDWGWELSSDDRLVILHSFDRDKGIDSCLGYDEITGLTVDTIMPLDSPLISAPLFNIYNCKSIR